jgi:hypothetical protein
MVWMGCLCRPFTASSSLRLTHDLVELAGEVGELFDACLSRIAKAAWRMEFIDPERSRTKASSVIMSL